MPSLACNPIKRVRRIAWYCEKLMTVFMSQSTTQKFLLINAALLALLAAVSKQERNVTCAVHQCRL